MYRFQIVINFRVFCFFVCLFFVVVYRIYKPLIEKKDRDHLDSNLFLLKRWEFFADHSGQCELYESKNCHTCHTYLSSARDVDRRIRNRPDLVAHKKLHNSMHWQSIAHISGWVPVQGVTLNLSSFNTNTNIIT